MEQQAGSTIEQDPSLRLNPELVQVLEEFGVSEEHINPKIRERLRLLDEKTETLKDSLNQTALEKKIFSALDNNNPFSPLEQTTSIVGTIFSDIGKTGPRGSSPEEQSLITSMYAVENVIEPEKLTVRDFLERYFPDDAGQFIQAFGTIRDTIVVTDEETGKETTVPIALDPAMTMRQFYNMHSKWTLDIISNDGVPPEAVAAAASHHFAQGINPEGIIGDDGSFKNRFGENHSFDRAEKLVIVMDQYDARRRRGKLDHHAAVAGVRSYIERSTFNEDQEFRDLINILEHIGEE
jgi:hypothetical protein